MRKIWILAFFLCLNALASEGHHSGIIGQLLLVDCPVSSIFGCPPRPLEGGFAIYDQKGRLVAHVETQPDGFFIEDLKPGGYLLVPDPPGPNHGPTTDPVEVRVEFKQYTPVVMVFAGSSV